MRVGEIVDAHADAAVAVFARDGELGAHLCVCLFIAGRCAVFAIERDVEHGPHLGLQGQRPAHELLAAGVVVDGGDVGQLAFAFEEDLGRAQQLGFGHGGIETAKDEKKARGRNARRRAFMIHALFGVCLSRGDP